VVIRLLSYRYLLSSKDLNGVIVLHLIDNRYIDHIYDVDAWLRVRDFPNAPDESAFWRIKENLNLPEQIEFDAIGVVFETIDYPYTDVRWPIMSKRMLETLLSVRDFRHRAYPLLIIDCETIVPITIGSHL
jgi:hypothetical protein